jgi:hypothetical protein
MPATLTITPWPDPLLDTTGVGNYPPARSTADPSKRRIKGAPDVPIWRELGHSSGDVRCWRSVRHDDFRPSSGAA